MVEHRRREPSREVRRGVVSGNFCPRTLHGSCYDRKLGLSALCSAHNVSNTALGEGEGGNDMIVGKVGPSAMCPKHCIGMKGEGGGILE